MKDSYAIATHSTLALKRGRNHKLQSHFGTSDERDKPVLSVIEGTGGLNRFVQSSKSPVQQICAARISFQCEAAEREHGGRFSRDYEKYRPTRGAPARNKTGPRTRGPRPDPAFSPPICCYKNQPLSFAMRPTGVIRSATRWRQVLSAHPNSSAG